MWLRIASFGKFYQINEMTGEYRWKHDNMCAVNKLDTQFFHQIIKSYYECYIGNVAFLKSYIAVTQMMKAKKIMNKIINSYPFLVKSAAFINELFYLTKQLKTELNRTFLNKLTMDYFMYNPKNCLMEIINNKSLSMFLLILPILPLRFFISLKRRSIIYVKQLINKIKKIHQVS